MEGVPTMYIAILNHPESGRSVLPNLRVCISGGSPFPVDALLRFENAFACTILEGYGLSETSPVACFNHPGLRVPGSIGLPVRGVDLRVVDERGVEAPNGDVGEIVVRGHNVMKAYWNRPEETAAAIVDGWFHTGDLGRVDADGIFTVVDRKKDLIIRGGYNVYPREVEEVLYEHPAVAEAAVVGVSNAELGEEIAAAVMLRPGIDANEDELRQFVKERLAAYKYPRHIRIVDALPKGPTGKILKRVITSEWNS
jgi:long-chain acyl-CoA synthetase